MGKQNNVLEAVNVVEWTQAVAMLAERIVQAKGSVPECLYFPKGDMFLGLLLASYYERVWDIVPELCEVEFVGRGDSDGVVLGDSVKGGAAVFVASRSKSLVMSVLYDFERNHEVYGKRDDKEFPRDLTEEASMSLLQDFMGRPEIAEWRRDRVWEFAPNGDVMTFLVNGPRQVAIAGDKRLEYVFKAN